MNSDFKKVFRIPYRAGSVSNFRAISRLNPSIRSIVLISKRTSVISKIYFSSIIVVAAVLVTVGTAVLILAVVLKVFSVLVVVRKVLSVLAELVLVVTELLALAPAVLTVLVATEPTINAILFKILTS